MTETPHPQDAPAASSLPWRTGRKVRRTIYAQPGPYPSDDDALIGMMDTRELALAAVRAHNWELRRARSDDEEST